MIDPSRIQAIEDRLNYALDQGNANAVALAQQQQSLWQNWTDGQSAGSFGSTELVFGVAGSGIPARSGTTLGSASVTLYLKSAATLTSSGTATAYNAATVPVIPGGFVILVPRGDGSGEYDSIPYQPGLVYALTGAGGIGARSGLTLGSATVTLYTVNAATLTLSAVTATCYNGSTSPVGGSKVIGMLPRADGSYDVVMESC